MVTLRVVTKEGSSDHELAQDRVTTIGRGRGNTIAIADAAMSKNHAKILYRSDGWYIIDTQSRNGTFVNNHRVSDLCPLGNGAKIRVGGTELILQVGTSDEVVIDEDESVDNALLSRIDASELHSTREFKLADLHSQATGEADPTARLAQLERKLRLIQVVNEKLVSSLDAKALLHEILALVAKETKATRGFVCQLQNGGSPKPMASLGLSPNDPMRISRTVLRQMLEERSGILLHTDLMESAMKSLAGSDIKSTLCAPLWISDKITGFISLDIIGVERCFSDADLDLVMAVAHQAAVGIERGRLADEAARQQHVQSYLSQYLDDKIVSLIGDSDKEDPLQPTEQEVTILFADIVSFTKISEGLEPGQVAEFMRHFLTVMTDIIFAHGGTIDKYIGDSIMAIFGAPIPSEDAATQALRAAIEMREHLIKLTVPGSDRPVQVRFGINTGTVVVGNIGSARRIEYTAIGDAVNVAARLEDFARPNEICLDELTKSKAAGDLLFQEIGSIDVRKRLQPVRVFKVMDETMYDSQMATMAVQ